MKTTILLTLITIISSVFSYGQSVRFIGYGDCRDNESGHRSLTSAMAQESPLPSLILNDGDTWTGYSYSSFESHFTDNSVFANYFDEKRILVAYGNHDSSSDIENSGCYKNSNWNSTEAIYAFKEGNTYFICLGKDPEQNQDWLVQRLESQERQSCIWTVVWFHYTVYSSQSHETHGVPSFEAICDQYNVDVAFYGHSHYYERCHWRRNNQIVSTENEVNRDQQPGTLYLLTGAGGQGDRSTPEYFTSAAWCNTGYAGLCYAVFDATDESLTLTTKNAAKQVIDQFVIVNQRPGFPTVSISEPIDEHHFESPQQITIQASASDDDGTISQVEFFVNGSSIGTDNSSPFSIDWTIPQDGNYSITASATDNSGNTTSSKAISIGAGAITETITVSASSTAEENISTGSVSTSSSDLELICDGVQQEVGLQFSNLGIPDGATINSAFIQFTVDEASTGTANLTIHGESSNSAEAFQATTIDITKRTKTNTSVNWSPADWPSADASGADQQSSDVSSILQEIINGGGWSTQSSIALIITGNDCTAKRVAESSGSLVTLNISYTVGGSKVTTPVIGNVTATPNNPRSSDDIIITSSITDDIGISSATIIWGTSSGDLSNQISMSSEGDSYSGSIPMQSDGTSIYYQIVANDDDGNTTNSLEQTLSISDATHITFADYDNIDLTFAGFGGGSFTEIANPVAGGINTSGFVGECVNSEPCETWAGIYSVQLSSKIDFSTMNIFNIKVYSPISCNVVLKLEDNANANIATEVSASTTTTQEWENLSFDFSNEASNTYDKIVIFFDFGNTAGNTFYFDDLLLSSSDVIMVNNPINNDDISIFPNPVSSDILNISLSENNCTKIDLINIQGKVVSRISNPRSDLVKMNVGSLNSGIYFIKVISNDLTITRKIIIQ